MFDKNTEQSVQFHAVPTGTSDVVALPELGSIAECSIGLHAQSSEFEVCKRECMFSALKHQRIRSVRSDRNVTL